jgi:hypothetical protein
MTQRKGDKTSQSLKQMVSEKVWQECTLRLKMPETDEVLHQLFDHVVKALAKRIEEIRTDDGKAISFFTEGREFLTINVTRKDLRIYIHPKAGASFDSKAKFEVEKFRFWDTSYHKASGKYRAMSVWISQKKHLPRVKEIIDFVPKTT